MPSQSNAQRMERSFSIVFQLIQSVARRLMSLLFIYYCRPESPLKLLPPCIGKPRR